MQKLFSVALGTLIAASAPLHAQTHSVPPGVYECYGQGMAEGGTVGNGAGQLNVSGARFAVVGANSYISRGGGSGHFSFDGLTLAMIDGPLAGIRYHRATAAWTFNMLRANGQETAFMCPRNTSKNPQDPLHW